MSTARFPNKRKVQTLEDEDEEEWDQYADEQFAEEGDDSFDGEGEGSSSGRKRGANQGTVVTRTAIAVDRNGRVILQWAKGKFITASASRHISANIKAYLGGPYDTFCKIQGRDTVPERTQDLLWTQFKNRYTWPAENEQEIKNIWLSEAKGLIRGIFYTARKDARQRCGSDIPADWKDHGPDWLSPEYWNKLCLKWNTEGWLKLSKSGRKNRLTVKSGSITKHTGGSIMFVAHEHRMSKELGRPVKQTEFFKRVHKKSKGIGDFVDNKSKLVCEKYEHSIEEKQGQDVSSQPDIDVDLWCQASEGPNKNGQVYGLGTSLSLLQPKSIPSTGDLGSQLTLQEASEKIEKLTKEKEDMIQRIEEVKREEEQKRKEFEQQMEEKSVEEEKKRIAFQEMVLMKINGL